jgi:hypothetical protein
MQIGTLFTRVIPQARNRGFMLIAGFDPKLSQKTMVRFITLSDITSLALFEAEKEIAKMLGVEKTEDVTHPAIAKKLNKIFESQPRSYKMR